MGRSSKGDQPRKRIYGIANAHRIERELVERFGVFKAFVAHPLSVRWRRRFFFYYPLKFIMIIQAEIGAVHRSVLKDQLIGDPILPQPPAWYAFRLSGKMPIIKFVLLACLLFAVHPVLILTGLVMLQCLHRQMKAPKGKFTRDPYPVSTIDAVVYGGGLRGLYTAALLARAGGR